MKKLTCPGLGLGELAATTSCDGEPLRGPPSPSCAGLPLTAGLPADPISCWPPAVITTCWWATGCWVCCPLVRTTWPPPLTTTCWCPNCCCGAVAVVWEAPAGADNTCNCCWPATPPGCVPTTTYTVKVIHKVSYFISHLIIIICKLLNSLYNLNKLELCEDKTRWRV